MDPYGNWTKTSEQPENLHRKSVQIFKKSSCIPHPTPVFWNFLSRQFGRFFVCAHDTAQKTNLKQETIMAWDNNLAKLKKKQARFPEKRVFPFLSYLRGEVV